VDTYRCSALVIDDEIGICNLLSQILRDEFEVLTADSAEAARRILAVRTVDIVIADQLLPGETGVQLLHYVCATHPKAIRILMTGLGRLDDLAEAINCGQIHFYLPKPWSHDQLLHTMSRARIARERERQHEQLVDELQRTKLELEQRVADRTRELEAANRRLHEMAHTDELTGLPNRRAIESAARNEIIRVTRYPTWLALGLVDVDDFKEINSRYLHPGGDHVLAWLGRRLQSAVRAVDTIARVGGDEFMILAPDTDLQGAERLAERMQQVVSENATEYAGAVIRVSISVGIVAAPPGQPPSFEELHVAAAEALQEAKTRGNNARVVRAMQPVY
jgi:diguanylate cyclase (GGDEF)-like protein